MLEPFIARRKNKRRARKLLRQLFPDMKTSDIKKMIKVLDTGKSNRNFFIRHKKRIVGFLSVSMVVLFGRRMFFYVRSIVLDRKSRKSGVGSKVYAMISKMAIAKKFSHILLFSRPHREKAQNFWQKKGFKKFFNVLFLKKLIFNKKK